MQVLENELIVVPSRKLLEILEESVLMDTELIMKLHKRRKLFQDFYTTEGHQAKHISQVASTAI